MRILGRHQTVEIPQQLSGSVDVATAGWDLYADLAGQIRIQQETHRTTSRVVTVATAVADSQILSGRVIPLNSNRDDSQQQVGAIPIRILGRHQTVGKPLHLVGQWM